jgi:hypothetical protein
MLHLPCRRFVFSTRHRFTVTGAAREKTWGALLGVLGLPCNYARMPDLPVMLTGEDVGLFSDTDLRQLAAAGCFWKGQRPSSSARAGLPPQSA